MADNSIALDELETRFSYHPPRDSQPERYVQLRHKALEMAQLIVQLTPTCREQSLALTHLEQATMWANAAIARRE